MKKVYSFVLLSLISMMGFAEVTETLHFVGPAFQSCNWNCPSEAIALTHLGNGLFSWRGAVQAGEFKMLKHQAWQNSYVSKVENQEIVLGETYELNFLPTDPAEGVGDNKFIVKESGVYDIAVNTQDMTFMMTRYENSGLISVTAPDGRGERVVNIHSYSGKASATENPFRLLIGRENINGSKDNKWCVQAKEGWVIFSLPAIYAIDAFGFRDGKYNDEEDGLNANAYKVWVSTTGTDDDDWTEVINETGVEVQREKFHVLDEAVEARYIKLMLNTDDNYLRIYGVDIYGTYVRPVDGGIVSYGKGIVDYSTCENDSEMRTPANILDGNTLSTDNRQEMDWESNGAWVFFPHEAWVTIDLQEIYSVDKFILYESKDWISGYNVYVSTMGTEEADWTLVYDGAETKPYEDQKETAVKEAVLETPVSARYVKLEIPRANQFGADDWSTRILEFEVYEASGTTVGISTIESSDNMLEVCPSLLQQGQNIRIKGLGHLRICTLQGTVVYERDIAGTCEVNTVDFLPGVYLVQCATSEKIKKQSKVIVR